MGVSTLGATLAIVGEFEKLRADFFNQLAGQATNEGTRMVARYLGQLKSPVSEALECYGPTEREVILNTPIFEEKIIADLKGYFEERRLEPEVRGGPLLDCAIEFAQVLVDTYRHLYEQRIGDKAITFARLLYDIAVRDIKHLHKIKTTNYY